MSRRSSPLTALGLPIISLLVACTETGDPVAPQGPAIPVAPAFSLAMGQSCTPVPADLISWWPGDGHARDIQGPNDGSFVGGARVSAGAVGAAFDLDGVDDWIEVPDHPSLSFGDGVSDSPFTIEAWINLDDDPVSPPGGTHTIFTKQHTFVRPIRAEYSFKIQDATFKIEGNLWESPEDRRILRVGPALDFAWHHVAMTYTGDGTPSGFRLFVDGTEVVSSVILIGAYEAMTDTTEPARIGANGPSAAGLRSLFHGLIDELSLYGRALSASEINAIYGAGTAGKCRNPTTVLSDLMEQVEAINASNGIINSLDAKLDAALGALDDLNQNNDAAAVGSLQAFINAVEAQRDASKIDPVEAELLISLAQLAIDQIGA